MNTEQILLNNAKADVAMIRRMELREAALEVWAERDCAIDTFVDNALVDGRESLGTAEADTIEELAKTAEYLEWLAGRLYNIGWRRAHQWQLEAIYAEADAADLLDTQRIAAW